MKNKKLIISIVAVCMVIVISVLAVVGIRNNEPKVENNSTTTSTTASTTETTTAETTTESTTENPTTATTETTTKETTTSKKEEKTTVKNTKPVTTTKKQETTTKKNIETTTKKQVTETTTKEQFVFNPTIEYPGNGYGQWGEGIIIDGVPYYYSFEYDIKGYSIKNTTITFNCQMKSITEEIAYDGDYAIYNESYAVTGFDKVPIKGTVSDSLQVDLFTEDGTMYDCVYIRNYGLRNLKVGDSFTLRLEISRSDAKNISKIVVKNF